MAGSDTTTDPLDYDDYVRLIRQVDALVLSFESHPDEATRERVLALLTAVDLLHRSALARLVEGLREHGAAPALEGVRRDRVVETLLGLYDLAELDLPDEDGVPDGDPAAGPAAGRDGMAFVPRDQLTMGPPGRKHV